jgi:hypothetical protein
MKTVEQNVLLNELEGKVEHHLQIATRDFQNMSAEELLTPGEHGGWSIAQCLEHLNRYGQYYFPTIKRALDQKNIRDCGRAALGQAALRGGRTRRAGACAGRRRGGGGLLRPAGRG